MDTKQETWLARLAPTGKAQRSVEKRRQMKETVLKQLQRDIVDRGQELFDSMNLTVANEEGVTQRVLNYGVRDQLTEFDLDEQQDGYTLQSDEDLAKHLKAQRMVALMAQELEQEVEQLDEFGVPVLDDQGQPIKKPLFSEQELKEVLYQPLVRQGLLSETFVPDDFSVTREMLDGAFDEYAERLKSEPLKSGWSENKSLVLTCIKSTGTIVNSSFALDGLGKMETKDFQAKWNPMAKDIAEKLSKGDPATLVEVTTKGVEHVLTIGDGAYEDISDRVLESRERTSEKRELPLRRKKAASLANQFIMNVAAALGGEVTQIHDATGRAVSSSYATVTKVNDVAKHLAAEEFGPKECRAISSALAAGLETCLTKSAPAGVDPTPMVDAGKTMQRELVAAIDREQLLKCLNEENFSKAIELIGNAAAVAVPKGITQELRTLLADAGNQQKIAQAVDQQMTEEFLAVDEELAKQQQAEREELEKLTGDVDAFAGRLQEKIDALYTKQQLIKWAASLAGLGFDAASKVLAPLAIAGGAVKVAQNVYEAVMRTMDLYKFTDHHTDMIKAASAFHPAVDQFCSNAAKQAAHYTAVAALELVKMIGAIVECTGFGAAAGKGIQAVGDIGSAIEAVLYEIGKRMDLEKAWTTYKMALLRPANRKLGLIAIKKNPTLAKYAVAWGAVIRKDPLVKDFMGSCGLNENTLKDPQANVDKVVKYLELRMPDDNVVVGRQVLGIDWAPKPIALTLTCWAGAKSRAETKANLVPKATRSLEAALTELEMNLAYLRNAVEAQTTPLAATVNAANDLLNTIESEFKGMSPKRLTDDQQEVIHAQMQDVITEFVSCVGDARQEVASLAAFQP